MGGFVPMTVRELLRDWPSSISETMHRSFMNICRLSERPGQTVECRPPDVNQYLFFSTDPDERTFYLEALKEKEVVDDTLSHMGAVVIRLTPSGWLAFEETESVRGSINNPAFVAMAFGRDEREQIEKLRLFEDVIRAACTEQGWRAERSDTQEYNSSIIDKIISMIRGAPYVIVDLSDNNLGAYYEAGFAHGMGKEVILLVKESVKPHFDLSGFNQIRWKDDRDLSEKLALRIERTVGRGPHVVPEDVASGERS